MQRYGRQAMLAEVGEAGQAKIGGARVASGARGFAGNIAARYLAGAGVGSLTVVEESAARAARSVNARVHVEISAHEIPAPAVGWNLRHEAARDLAAGARLALRALTAVLERTP